MFLRHNASATLLSITPIPLTRLSRQPWTASARSVRAVSSTGVVPHTAIQVYSSWTRISTAILPSSGWDCIENLTQSLLSHIMNFCSSTKWRSMTRNLARIFEHCLAQFTGSDTSATSGNQWPLVEDTAMSSIPYNAGHYAVILPSSCPSIKPFPLRIQLVPSQKSILSSP